MIKVDVIVPYYNVPIAYLRAAMESILAQTYPDWRAIIINDGSSDEYTAQVESYIWDLPRDRLVYVKTPNHGPANARNTGIRATDAPYIALLDSDDAWYPQKLESQVRLLEDNPGVAMVHSGVDLMDGDGRTTAQFVPMETRQSTSNSESLARMLRSNRVVCCSAIFRRDAAATVRFFDESFKSMEDKMLWIEMLINGYTFHYQNEATGRYRVHSSNMSKNVEKLMRGRKMLIDKVDSLAKTCPILKEIGWENIKKEMVAHMYQETYEGYLEQRKFMKALQYLYPFYLFFRQEHQS